MTSPTLTDLAALVEKLTGPCRETDALLWWQTNRAAAERVYWNAAPGKPYPLENEMPHGMGRFAVTRFAPAFTASLDAAMTLVPEGLPILVRDGYDDAPGDKRPYAHVMNDIGEGYAATKALAIVVASLRARAALESSHG